MAASTEFFWAIHVLVSPPSNSSDAQPKNGESPLDDAERFDLSLASTLDNLHQAIKDGTKCRNVATSLGPACINWEDRLENCKDIRWLYVEHCLMLLQGLKNSVIAQMLVFREEREREQLRSEKSHPDAAPPLSPDTFSIGQQKNLMTLLQFIVRLGLVPNLEQGVGVPIERRSGFGEILASQEPKLDASRLKFVLKVLLECVEQPSLGGLILTRHLGDLLAALLQICYSSHQQINQLGTQDNTGFPVKSSDHSQIRPEFKVKESASDKVATCEPLFSSPGSIGLRSKTALDLCQSPAIESDCHTTSTCTSQILREENLCGITDCVRSSTTRSDQDDSDNVADAAKRQALGPEEFLYFQAQLKRLLQKSFQPLVIRELLFLQGGPGPRKRPVSSAKRSSKHTARGNQNPFPRAPGWLRKECGRLLSERFMQPKGIQWVLRGLLDVGGGAGGSVSVDSTDWRKCDAVAQLIADCPVQDDTLEKYYKVVCPQVLELFHFPDQVLLKQVIRVACSCIVSMVTLQPKLADAYLIRPLLEPLLSTLDDKVEGVSIEHRPAVLVDEPTLSRCIEDIHHIFVSSSVTTSCLREALQPVVHPIFELLCFAKQGVCHLRSMLEDIFCTFFCNSDKHVALKYLQHVIFLRRDTSLKSMHKSIAFRPGSDGGAVVMLRSDISVDEQFTESLMSQDHRASTVLDLLQKVKVPGLAGDFFIMVLKELTTITSSSAPHFPNQASQAAESSQTLLDIEEDRALQINHLQHSLQILALLSKLCEGLGPAALENITQMLEFASATLGRAAASLDDEGDGFNIFETETLTLAFGLVSAILSGVAEKKVTSEHQQALTDLLPSLEKISNKHSVEPLQRTATDLRIAIATHGAVWSDSMQEAIEKLKSSQIVAEGTSKAKDKMAEGKIGTLTGTILQEQCSEGASVEDIERQSDAQSNGSKAVTGTSQAEHHPTHEGAESSKKQHDRHFASESSTTANAKDSAVKQDFDQAFQELFDPLLPTRGHALRALGKLLLARDPKAVQKRDMLVGIFEENLSHEDSYIYLSAIQALTCVADVFPDRVIPHLCQELVAFQGQDKDQKRVARTAETRVKLGEALVRATRSLGELVPHYGNILLGAFLQGVRDTDPVVRASSLSNLADVCKLLRFSLGPNLHEVLNCLTAILRSDPEVQVRRACVLVLTLLLRGLGKDALKVLEDVIRDIYRGLKLALSVEKDDVIRLHCQLALEEIDVIMRDYLFPKQTLTKKITVLP